MIATGLIRDCIREAEKTPQIPSVIAAGTAQYGMQTFDQSLYRLYREDLISFEEALRQATNPDEFKLRVAGIHSTSDVATDQMDQAATKGNSLDPQHPDSPFEFSRS